MAASQSMDANELLLVNQQAARISMGARYEKLDWDIIQKRRDVCLKKEKSEPWKICPENFLMLPQLMPASDKVADHYEQMNQGLTLGAGIEQYLDMHVKDPHLLQPLLKMRQAVADQGFDVNNDITTSDGLRPYFLIAFGTGDGSTLQALVDCFKPHHVVIGLNDWQDFATSFWKINWQELGCKQQSERGGKITIGCYREINEILSVLCNECHAGIDHAMIYLPPEGGCSPDAKKSREGITSVELNSSVNYLGYTIDEHNMVWNSWQSLSRQPRVYCKPQLPLGERMVVCGSGPSLDANLEGLRELSRTHWIVSCGSNFRTLKANNIRVDFLAHMERSDDTFHDMKEVVDIYGAGETRLIVSSTCHWQMAEMFVDNMSFFRPALTPLSIFSNRPAEILNFEGPEGVNCGVALATALGMSQVVLIGVDLGSRSLDKIRSDQAIGASPRVLDLECEANFGGVAYSSVPLRDVRISLESCLRCHPDVDVFNLSDGVAIKGAMPCSIDDRLRALDNEDSIPEFDQSKLGQWWQTSLVYTPQRFLSSWSSRRPRAESAKLINSLRQLFQSDEPWSPNVICHVTNLLSLDVPLAAQFPRRVLRSTFHKLVIAVNRQIMVMAAEPEKAKGFEEAARAILIDLLDPCEQELYELCDAVEALPVRSGCDDRRLES